MTVWFQLIGSDGMPAFMGGGPFFQEELKIDVSALPGSYRLVGRTNTGIEFERIFEILGLENGGAPVRIELDE